MLCPSSRCPWRRYGAVLWLTKRCAGLAAVALSTRMVLFLAVHEGASRGAQRCGQAAGALVPKFSDIYLTGEA